MTVSKTVHKGSNPFTPVLLIKIIRKNIKKKGEIIMMNMNANTIHRQLRHLHRPVLVMVPGLIRVRQNQRMISPILYP